MITKETNTCLGCREKKPLHIRGLCIACYHQMRRTLKQVPEAQRDAAERKLVDVGKLLPRHAGNPFAEEWAEFLNPPLSPPDRPLAPHEQAFLDQATGPGASSGPESPPVARTLGKKAKKVVT